MMFGAEFWVALAFLTFLAALGWLGVHEMMINRIDGRRNRIKAELDEAVRLKEEARALLSQYQRKQREVEQEAREILAAAEAAVAAAGKILAETVKDGVAHRLVAKGIDEMKRAFS